MAKLEFAGQNLEEAINRAAAALNLAPERLKFSVLSMGAKGFLGFFGRRPARVAVDPDDPQLDLGEAAAAPVALPAAALDAADQLVRLVARELISHMGLSAEITLARSGSSLILTLDSPDNALLIGPRGVTLAALQLMVAKIYLRRLKEAGRDQEPGPRVVVEVAGYRPRIPSQRPRRSSK
ncbi:MAG: Jag N-terminal domain-containing protein [Candidatus Adiutrix sp.]|jgi:predicted RNA-binding protein Jag|nr:Jag N-terminal domain-containing protein [Candidatus Adiutrix sp.]